MSDFELLDERNIAELRTHARLFRHKKTGAELLSLENEDENKVFGITFRTPPPDSTGLPHILEHSVLAGSQKFPARDPFIELMKGSMATFVNAMTYPDMTTYPVASQNTQDFYNLIEVYVDAVLYPLNHRHTFMQEGWRYELEDPEKPLAYRGVVFNEMKGAYSAPENLLAKHSIEALFPGHPYGSDAGGDPRCIPDLTYEQFKAFHTRYYHPSNSRIFFYGNDDPAERLRKFGKYLSGFEALQADSDIPIMQKFSQPKWLDVPYGASEDANARKGLMTVNWMLDEMRSPELSLAMAILNHILIGTPASPLRKALIDSGLGDDLTGGGLEMCFRQPSYSVGLKGILPEDARKVEALVLDTLAALVRGGIDPETVAASFNTVEFHLRENNTGRFPRGLSLMLRAIKSWLHGGDPLERLAFEVPLGSIKNRLAVGEMIFEQLIQEYWLDNPHRVAVLLRPDPELHQREEEAESERLLTVKAGMDQAQIEQVIADGMALKLRQETPDPPEVLATIPGLRLEDLDRENKILPLQVLDLDGTRLLYHDIFTNGIVYLDVGFDLHNLPQELVPLSRLFGRALVEMGTEKEDFVRLSQRIGRSTGGIRSGLLVSGVNHSSQSAAWLFLRGKAMLEKSGVLLDILTDLLLTVKLDNQERFRQMVLEEKAELEAALIPAGSSFVNTRLRAQFDQAGWLAEETGGISYLFYLRRLAEAVEENWPLVLSQLEQVRRTLINRAGLVCNLTVDEPSWLALKARLAEFCGAISENVSQPAAWKIQELPVNEGLTIPAQVNYVGKAANLYNLGYNYHASVAVITNTLRTTWLYEKVRLRGGAYDGTCAFDRHSGVFSYLSYRDPNLMETLDNYAASASFLRSLDLSQAELCKSIIGTIGEMDTYLLPDAKGYSSMMRYLTGDTEEERQQRREQVLGTTPDDFRRFGEILEALNATGRVVVMGAPESIQRVNSQKPGFLVEEKVL